MAPFAVPTAPAPVRGTFRVPPSKSIHQRALAAAVLADGVSTIEAPGEPAGDVARLGRALSALAGRPVPLVGAIEGACGGGFLGAGRGAARCDLGMNGTGLRFAVALAGDRPPGARTLVTGAPRLLARPHGPLLRALSRLGAHARRRPSGSIRIVAGPWSRHEVAIPADVSSQFASGILLAAARQGGAAVRLVGEVVSDAYLGLTCAVLGSFGVPVAREGAVLAVPARTPSAARIVVEGDASSAAAWWAAAARTGGRVVVGGVPWGSAQPDLAFLGVLERMGARVTPTAGGEILVEGPGGRLRGAGDVDLRASPDLAPLVGALAADAEGETRVVHAPQLRWKESDRVSTVVAAILAVGGDAEAREDGFVVRGRPLSGGLVRVAGDHRIAMAFGVLGLATPGVALEGAEAVGKSYPGFFEALAEAVGARAPRPPGRP